MKIIDLFNKIIKKIDHFWWLHVSERYRSCFLYLPLHNLKYWIVHRFHPSHRYHIIKTGLKPGYYEWRTRLVYGTFNDFVVRYLITKDFLQLDKEEIKDLDKVMNWWKNYDKRVDDNEIKFCDKEIDFDKYNKNVDKLDKETIKNINILWKHQNAIDW